MVSIIHKKQKNKIAEKHIGKHYGLGVPKPKKGKANIRKAAIKRVSDPNYINPFAGKHHSLRTKEILSAKARQRYDKGILPSNARRIKIGSKVYPSLTEASRCLGVSPALIIYRLKNKKYNYKYLD